MPAAPAMERHAGAGKRMASAAPAGRQISTSSDPCAGAGKIKSSVTTGEMPAAPAIERHAGAVRVMTGAQPVKKPTAPILKRYSGA